MGLNKNIREYACDTCDQRVVGAQVPSGWVGLRHTSHSYSSSCAQHLYLLFGAGSTGRTSKRDVPEDSWWCSAGCLKKWLLAQVEHHARTDLR